MSVPMTMTREIRISLDAQLLAAARRLALDLALERGVARLSLAAIVEEALRTMLQQCGLQDMSGKTP